VLGLVVYCLFHFCDRHHYCYFVVVIAVVANVSWLWSPSLLLLCGHLRYCYSMVTIVANAPWSRLLFYGRGCHHHYYFMVVVVIIVVFKVMVALVAIFFCWSKVFPPLSGFVQVWGVKCGAWIGLNSNYIHLSKFSFQCWFFFFFSFFVFLFSFRMFLCAFGILHCASSILFFLVCFFFPSRNWICVFLGWNEFFTQTKLKILKFFFVYFAHSFFCLYLLHLA